MNAQGKNESQSWMHTLSLSVETHTLNTQQENEIFGKLHETLKKNYKNGINIHMHSLLDTPTHTTVWNTKEQGIFSISQLLNVNN